ncbi:MAG TPA: hypothetical protein VK636_21855 [Gemmatimonadaceae bacterium]|nr:hypothetical protein [Gemmatimonadaceae bacterium]
MQLSISDVLDAYRADLSNAGRARFSSHDATWLAFGTLMQRAVGVADDERATYLRGGAARMLAGFPAGSLTATIDTLARCALADGMDDDDFDAALCSAAMAVAADAEDAGAFALATLIIDFARILVGLGEFRLQGRLLAQQARIFRKIGEMDSALELYGELDEIAATHGDQELVARAHLGKAAVARVRGNLPRAREEFSAILKTALGSNEIRELHMHAHHGLLIVSASAGDFDAALRHGSLALALARNEERRIEMLTNVSAVCFDVGQFRAALHGYLQVLGKTTIERVRIGAIGGAGTAAAHLGDRATVDTLARSATLLLAHHAHEYELADMAREFSEAYSYMGESELASTYREYAMERAQRGGFYEIIHKIESFDLSSNKARPRALRLADDALTVARELASGDSEELLLAAVGAGGQQWPPGTV